jgi:hypothetical protein
MSASDDVGGKDQAFAAEYEAFYWLCHTALSGFALTVAATNTTNKLCQVYFLMDISAAKAENCNNVDEQIGALCDARHRN